MARDPRFIEHQGTQILFQDLSNLVSEAEKLRAISTARSFVAALADRADKHLQLLVLTDFDGSAFTPVVLEAIKGLARHHKPYVRASAVLGLDPLRRVVLRTVSLLTGRSISAFDTREAALDWLIRQ